MLFIRNIAYFLFILLTVIPWCAMSLLVAPIPLRWRYRIITGWTHVAIWGAKFFCGIHYQIRGTEHIPTQGGVFLCKHQSSYETLLLCSILPRVSYVYKRSLHWLPFFGWGLALCGMIPIDRSKGASALRQLAFRGKERLKEGWSILLFPEGTRSPPGQSRHYHLGGAYLACAAGTPVIPIAHNAGDVWHKHSLKTAGQLIFSFGPPIPSAGKTPQQLIAEVENWIEHEMKTLFPHQFNQIPSTPIVPTPKPINAEGETTPS